MRTQALDPKFEVPNSQTNSCGISSTEKNQSPRPENVGALLVQGTKKVTSLMGTSSQ